ncbi:hypothetical protein GCM10009775_25560 [Microbacterium aoyamense]|uniref:DUF222 domain-containing protein n=1 Tax=Microbacterium aoyamense TaxID=344166 RepID=A0ABP5B5V0_9MICO|nr:HNH endonuclease signature motif containing protein [Microbacterium aoyamense]
MGASSTPPPPQWSALSDLVDDVVEVRSSIAALQAREARLLASAADLVTNRSDELRREGRRSRADLPLREVSAELGTAMRVSDRAIQGRIGDAWTLVTRFPATLHAWESGRVDSAHVSAILDAGAGIVDDDRRAHFEQEILRIADTESAPRLRAIARAIVAKIDPEGVQDRMTDAEARHMVRVTDRGDGMARLTADMSAPLAHGIVDRLTQMARAVKDRPPLADVSDADRCEDSSSPNARGPADVHTEAGCPTDAPPDDEASSADSLGRLEVVTGARSVTGGPPAPADQTPDSRTMDQLRLDILCDTLLGGSPVAHGDGLAAIAARVQVTIPALALAGRDAGPAIIAGSTPIDLASARRLAGHAPGWDRVLTDPFTGDVLAVDRYRPNPAIVRFLAARDEHCRFPGCRRPAHRCDIDHTVDAARGGATTDCNLAHFCRRHHTLKHESAWTVRQVGGGVLEWTSPTRRIYIDRPPPTVRFVPSSGHGKATPGTEDDPPPF